MNATYLMGVPSRTNLKQSCSDAGAGSGGPRIAQGDAGYGTDIDSIYFVLVASRFTTMVSFMNQ